MIVYFMIANENCLRCSGGGPVSVILNSSPVPAQFYLATNLLYFAQTTHQLPDIVKQYFPCSVLYESLVHVRQMKNNQSSLM